MTLSAGTRLGPYELSEMLGAGGMGEVYKARDTRLERSVAIKVLAPHLASNAALRERFEREAKTISSISHPNICALYDVGTTELGARISEPDVVASSEPLAPGPELHYLVMEYLEGESLAERLGKGPLPLEQVIRYGIEIASALDKAHRAGIVHRDLKPGNIMLTRAGSKLLDFGLAKYAQQPAPLEGLTSLPTEHRPLTQEGTILGTFQYMAPEQLAGEEADARTDIFALGAVLYEMLTGVRAFQGKNKTSLIGAIVSGEPRPVSALQPLTPSALEHVIKKCLAKEPDDRWQSAHDIAEELKWISEAGSQAGVASTVSVRRKRLAAIAWILIAVAFILGGAAEWAFVHFRSKPARRIESAIPPPDQTSFSVVSGPMALSPDGQQLAFVAGGALWVRPLASGVARRLGRTEGASSPFWSPDGRFLGFFAEGKLKKVAADGGSPEILADAPDPYGGTWNRQGDILFTTRGASVVARVSASGGSVVPLVTKGIRLVRPFFLPDGKHFLFTSFRASGEAEGIYVGSIDSKETKLVIPGAYSNSVYVKPGVILYWRDGDLRAQRFDLKKLEALGDPIKIADHVQYEPDSPCALFTASDDGTLIYATGSGAGMSELVWVDREGKDVRTLAPPAMYYTPRVSHDRRRVAVDLSDPVTAKGDIWIFDEQRKISTKLTYDPANESSPNWSPDDRHIVYFNESSGMNLFQKSSSGVGREEVVFEDDRQKLPSDWSRDGRFVLIGSADVNRSRGFDIWVLSMVDRTARPWLATEFNEVGAGFSPDGKWVTYSSNESGRPEVYVQSFDASGGKFLISSAGGSAPLWRRDGQEIIYVSPDRKLMAVPVRIDGATFEADVPVPLFGAPVRLAPVAQYDVSPDGKMFLLNRLAAEQGTHPFTFVQNWSLGVELR